LRVNWRLNLGTNFLYDIDWRTVNWTLNKWDQHQSCGDAILKVSISSWLCLVWKLLNQMWVPLWFRLGPKEFGLDGFVEWFCMLFFFVTSGFACFQTQTFVWTRYKDLINDHNINSMAWGVRTKGVCLVVYIVMCFGVHIYSTCIDVSESYMINIDQSVPCTSIKYTELLYSDSLSYYECHTTLVNELCEFQFCSVPSSN